MYNQSWKDNQVREETLLEKIIGCVIVAVFITATFLLGIVQYTN